jgi:hypothetical protein
MDYLMLIPLVVVGVVTAVLTVALVELYRHVQQIREYIDLTDKSLPVDLADWQGRRPTEAGLPAELDDTDHAVILFLSNKCGSCRTIAAGLGGSVPRYVWPVVAPVSAMDSNGVGALVEELSLSGPRTTVDTQLRITTALGLSVTPSAILVRKGRLDSARTIPSIRQLFALAPDPAGSTMLSLNGSKIDNSER